MKKTFIFTAMLMSCFCIVAQEKDVNSDFSYGVSLDFQTRYVWRGQPLGGAAPNFQPATYINWKGLEFGVWSSFAVAPDYYAELDMYLSYTFWKDRFTVILSDYAAPEWDDAYNYFDYNTNHVLELGFSYNGEEKVPISASLYVNVFGADAKYTVLDENFSPETYNMYSTYFELAYNPVWKKLDVDFSIFTGFALNSHSVRNPLTNENEYLPGFYGNQGFAAVNIGASATKTFSVGKLNIPLGVALIFNPNSKKAYFAATLGIAL
jgi:hypothetical protein